MIRRRFFGVIVALLAVTGCGHSAAPAAAPPSPSVTASPTPQPVRTIVRTGHVVAAGTTADFSGQPGASLQLTVSRPQASTHALSSSYGYAPQHRYYLTFAITIVNTGTQSVDIGPLNFFVRVKGQSKVTSYDGNSPFSGAPAQLDNTQLDPGQKVQGPLTFDVGYLHGGLAFVPDKTPAISWLF